MQDVSGSRRRAEGGQTEKAVAAISSPARQLITQPEPKNILDRGYCKSQRRYMHTNTAKETNPDVSGYQPPVHVSYLKRDLNAMHDIINAAFIFYLYFV